MSGVTVDSYRRVECAKAPKHWESRWLGPPDMAGTTPNFCPWCGDRLDSHNAYDVTISLNSPLAARSPSRTERGRDD